MIEISNEIKTARREGHATIIKDPLRYNGYYCLTKWCVSEEGIKPLNQNFRYDVSDSVNNSIVGWIESCKKEANRRHIDENDFISCQFNRLKEEIEHKQKF